MTIVSKATVAAGIVLAMASGLCPAQAESAQADRFKPAHAARADFGTASALAPDFGLRPSLGERVPQSDGLGRNDEDCKYGCIDH